MRFIPTVIASVIGTLVAFFIFFFLAFILIMAVALISDPTPTVRSGSILSMRLHGALPEISRDDPFQQLLLGRPRVSLRDVTESLRKAAADDRIAAVWLQTEDITVSWSALYEIREALLAYRQSGKPLIASSGMDGFTEKGYYLASLADAIYAPPEAGFELDGFFMSLAFFSDMLERLEVEPQIIRAGAYKSAVEPFTRSDMSEQNQEQMELIVRRQHDEFLQAIGSSRGISVDSLDRLAREHALYTAREAHHVGLVDSLIYQDEVIARLKEINEQDPERDLRSISLASYARVPAEKAGLRTGRAGDIAVVYATGTIVSGENRYDPNPLFGGEIAGAKSFAEAMREARRDDRVKAVVVRVNSPGGSVTASDAMWREMMLTREEKPLIVSMGALAASGGYWISAPADTIVANPLTLTGSIGVFSLLFDISGMMESRFGITFDDVKTSPFADAFSGLRPLRPEEQQRYESLVDGIYDSFLQKVADGRPLTVGEADEVGQGRVWTGIDAREVGLVDVLGGLDTSIRLAAARAGLEEDTYRIRILPRPRTFIEQITEAFSSSITSLWSRWTLPDAERLLLQHTRMLRQITDSQGNILARMPFDIEIK